MTLKEVLRKHIPFKRIKVSTARKESNIWLKQQAAGIEGKVLSIGSEGDDDREGDKYRNYFKKSSSYTTSEVSAEFNCDLVLDIRAMPEIKDETYDCIFCSGVLEHVDDYPAVLKEITRILKPGGILLLGLPFRQKIHLAPHDYWRFTEYGIRYMLRDSYEIIDLKSIDNVIAAFPATYWVKAKKPDHGK